MRTCKVVESIEIDAPRAEVFDIVTHRVRRFQLSPLWGVANVVYIDPDWPQVGACYEVELKDSASTKYDTVVAAFVPDQKFAYDLTAERQTRVTWTVQDVLRGEQTATRLIYEEEFLAEETESDEFTQSVRKIVKQWLTNIKVYAGLRGNWGRRVLRRFADWYLKLRPDQRRVVGMLVGMQIITIITFILAALGIGLMRLLFG
ncbi:MAG: SRPBCC family protein [Chloroflexi bacterium]|nr:SRPBCC family protein [Chloroflexota bacterium]